MYWREYVIFEWTKNLTPFVFPCSKMIILWAIDNLVGYMENSFTMKVRFKLREIYLPCYFLLWPALLREVGLATFCPFE